MSSRSVFDSPHALAILADALNDVGEPVFFGRRFLRYRDLVAVGLVNNRMTLWRMVRAGRFPPPIYNTVQVPLWDTLELAAMLRQRAAERSINNSSGGIVSMICKNTRGPAPPAPAPQEKVVA
jgi:predicted DNA-binding transcriptional regulator AlpA